MNKKCPTCHKPRTEWEDKITRRTYCSNRCRTHFRKPLRPGIRARIFERDNNKCRYCEEFADCVDHVVPVTHRGSNKESNLVACCTPCNMLAGTNLFKSFDEKKKWILSQWKERGIESTTFRSRYLKPKTIAKRRKSEFKEEYNLDRSDWRTWVYGGLKRLTSR
jgi:5-methylcytosine-specific restriction endonuclease McrA